MLTAWMNIDFRLERVPLMGNEYKTSKSVSYTAGPQ
jgi:hypothetical protein